MSEEYIEEGINGQWTDWKFEAENYKKIYEHLYQENQQLKEVIEKANNELITLIQIIMEQPSENAVDDLWLLNRLEGISIILDKVKGELENE